MSRTSVRLIVLVLTVVLGASIAMTSSSALEETIYTFEVCEEGWEFAENDDAAIGGDWERSSPGHESEFAMRMDLYPIGQGAPEDTYEATLTAKPHSFDGGEATVSFWVSHNLETDFDFLYLESSTDGETWVERAAMTGVSEGHPDFVEQATTFEHPKGPLHLRFRLVSDQFISGDPPQPGGDLAVDDIKVPAPRPEGATCEGEPSPSPTDTTSPSPSPSPSEKCTQRGTHENDQLRGTPRSDTLCGRRGHDLLSGKEGDDLLKGGRGQDQLYGGPGRDVCRGGPRFDSYRGCEEKPS